VEAKEHMRTYQEWLVRRPKATYALIVKALDILDRPTGHAPEELDKLTIGYISILRKYAGKDKC
jgi:hypothetical protein